ncbi:hypothetical protein MMC10_006917 [Thelotrema lepadinum]|nr:hypothetical protein [Thelotrema lepadinum]
MTAQSKSNGTAEVASGSREPSNLSSSHTTVPEGDVLRNESFGSDLVGLGDSLDGCLAQQPNSNFPFTTDFSSLHHNVAMNPTLDWPVLPPQTSGTGTPFTAMGVNMLDPHTDKILSGNSEQFASAMDFSYHGSHTPALAQPLVDSGQRSDPPGAISESSSQPWTRYGDEESDEDEDLEDEAMAVDSRGGEIEQPGSNTGDSNGKTSTVVISHAKPEMVRKVVDLLFSSNSTVDVKIFDQKSESEQKE